MIEHDIQKSIIPRFPNKKTYTIGIIGAGFIVRDCHLPAYKKAGFNAIAITSLDEEQSKSVAAQFGIERVHSSWKELIDDRDVQILDIAVPPHIQPEIVQYACEKDHILAILCQKPSAIDYKSAKLIADVGRESGKLIGVNSNMRYDPSIRALKYCLDRGLIGEPVVANLEQHAIPHWQTFVAQYNRLTFLNFSIHELDCYRYLFGDPKYITAVCRTDPRLRFEHSDGIIQFTYAYENGLLATSLDDTFACPDEPCAKDTNIRWRVTGSEGVAKGTIGWPEFPALCPSTFQLACKQYPNAWIRPAWDVCWFPDAFMGTMSGLLCALEDNTQPEISAEDHARTIACVEACYRSTQERRTIALDEIIGK